MIILTITAKHLSGNYFSNVTKKERLIPKGMHPSPHLKICIGTLCNTTWRNNLKLMWKEKL
jgi:hypothetical protein